MTFSSLTRRSLFILGGSALLGVSGLGRAWAAADAPALTAVRRTIEVQGRSASVFGLIGPDGRAGVTLDPGDRFRFRLTNGTDDQTLIHWHGQIPPHAQDGVPGLTAPILGPGDGANYDFAPRPGTHWMHAHVPVQEMALMAAPLIVRTKDDAAADRQEVVMMLHDFSFTPPQELLAGLGISADMAGMGHGADGDGAMPMMMDHSMHGAGGMAMDLNDIDFDAYLVNDRTLDDPEVVAAERGGRILLRIINGSAATAYLIDTGVLAGQIVAVDGTPVRPVSASGAGLGMGQRLDIELTLPAKGGAFPILARREGSREQTGLILATPGARITRVEGLAGQVAPAFDRDMAQENRLAALAPLIARPADRSYRLDLGGAMMPYLWTINGQVWGNHEALQARSGERVEITFVNSSHMAHPMHLHGHDFQITAIGGRPVAGARRDTLWVPPGVEATVALDAGEPGRWMLHCHHMPHLQTGMATELAVTA